MAALRWVLEHKHRAWGFFWIICIIPTLLWWKESVLWVALMSLYANAETAFGAHQAQRAREANEPTTEQVRKASRRYREVPRSDRRHRKMVHRLS